MNIRAVKWFRGVCGAAVSFISVSMLGITAMATDFIIPENLSAGVAMILDADVYTDVIQVSEQQARIAEETPLEEEEPDLQMSDLIIANVKDSVNVRAEADEEAEVVGKLYKDCAGEILERSNGWTKFKSGNLEGWAKDEYLYHDEEAQEKAEEIGQLKATIQTDALRVRKEPDDEAGVYGLLAMNKAVEAVEDLGEWVSVQYDDDTVGYVNADFVEVEFAFEYGETLEEIKENEAQKKKAALSNNRGAVAVGVSDVQLLAALIQCEAGNQPYDGQLAVGSVVMNRVRSGRNGGTVSGVINAPGQFPPATNGKVASVLARGPKASCVQAAEQAIAGASTVGGATRFSRAGSRDGIVIGGHVFW